MSKKQRLDLLLTEREIYSTRSKAKRAIMAGQVYVDNQLVDKAGTPVKLDCEIEIKGNKIPYVSRGGLKLAKALEIFPVKVQGKEVIDIGASTGGFTDCLLQQGAKKIYAIDVGYGQIAWKLRQDERVVVLERTNFRYLSSEQLAVKVPLIVTDVSFISLKLILPAALSFLTKEGEIIALIKPQFEAGPERVGKKGIVKEQTVHIDIIKELSLFLSKKGLFLADLYYSPITGANSKNIEFLIYLKNTNEKVDFSKWEEKIRKVVSLAHQQLKGG